METTYPLREKLAQILQRQPPPRPQPPTPTLPNSLIKPQNQLPNLVPPIEQPLPLPNDLLLEPPELLPPIEQPLGPLPLPNVQQQEQQQQHYNFDFPEQVIAFCLSGAMGIATQNHTVNPRIFHLLCLMVVFAFVSIFVAKSIAPKHPNAAHKLEYVGVFFGVTAFFLAVTVSFPLYLVIISWIIYAISLIVVLICNCPQPLFPL
ncbi:hypothetical protein Vadar_028402 [Vaccinium darrowii]|uniref:Uncharacterized protein n=1 Tax=Vaccinium darrowii TaxID=229202 RepID=A0ACB7YZK5_9ERIC|nr:hypothetical protein Vadar_028402 [Vaccinium darrowii]